MGLRCAASEVARVKTTRVKRADGTFVSAVVCTPERSSMRSVPVMVMKSSFEVSICAVMVPSWSSAVVRRAVRRTDWPQSQERSCSVRSSHRVSPAAPACSQQRKRSPRARAPRDGWRFRRAIPSNGKPPPNAPSVSGAGVAEAPISAILPGTPSWLAVQIEREGLRVAVIDGGRMMPLAIGGDGALQRLRRSGRRPA